MPFSWSNPAVEYKPCGAYAYGTIPGQNISTWSSARDLCSRNEGWLPTPITSGDRECFNTSTANLTNGAWVGFAENAPVRHFDGAPAATATWWPPTPFTPNATDFLSCWRSTPLEETPFVPLPCEFNVTGPIACQTGKFRRQSLRSAVSFSELIL